MIRVQALVHAATLSTRFIAGGLVCTWLITVSGIAAGYAATSTGGVAATAHPLASQAAIEILSQGGNAVDAAVAAGFAIGVVEPDGSGLGGGGGMLIYLHKTRETIYINYYHDAQADYGAIKWDPDRDRDTAKSVLVPGTVAGLCEALENYGTLPLPVVIEPALRYARDGFRVDATLAGLILDFMEIMAERPELAQVFLTDEFPKMEGDLVKQPKLVRVLQLISENGRDGFYKGETARALVDGLTAQGGVMSLDDLAGYEVSVSEPVWGTYRGIEIAAASAPHSGAALIEIMNMLELLDFDPAVHFSESAQTIHMMSEIFRRGYADRSWYIGDPRFTSIPIRGLTSKAYAREILTSINRFRAEPRNYRDTPHGFPGKYDGERDEREIAAPKKQSLGWGDDDDGDDPGLKQRTRKDPFNRWDRKQQSDSTRGNSDDERFEGSSTTHLSVIDADSNMVALTQTLGNFWGSKVMINGILLNNGRVNFSAISRTNLIEPRKRPRSSITPTLIFRDGKPAFALGSPGAGRIIATIALVIVNLVDYNMDVQSANEAPRFFCQKFDDHLSLESRISVDIGERLTRMGHSVRFLGNMDLFFGGVQVTGISPDTGELVGSADPRRGGNALSVERGAETGVDH
jgi:gamma-glutamyltranspeptidase/glutathione hydrolase